MSNSPPPWSVGVPGQCAGGSLTSPPHPDPPTRRSATGQRPHCRRGRGCGGAWAGLSVGGGASAAGDGRAAAGPGALPQGPAHCRPPDDISLPRWRALGGSGDGGAGSGGGGVAFGPLAPEPVRLPARPPEGGGANYWAPLTRKRHTMPHPAQPQHTNYWAPRTRKRHQQEHRPQRPTESSDPTQHAKGRTGDCPGPRKETTTRRTVTRGGGGGCGGVSWMALRRPPRAHRNCANTQIKSNKEPLNKMKVPTQKIAICTKTTSKKLEKKEILLFFLGGCAQNCFPNQIHICPAPKPVAPHHSSLRSVHAH